MRIAIDAGHGPETPGKRCPDESMREYHFNSVVAGCIVQQLQRYENIIILPIHSDERDVPLKERTDKANMWGADVFVSIHANAMGNGWSAAQGIETFVYTTRPPAAVALANAIQRQLIQNTGRPDRGVKSADFHVLRETHMTAVLVECGFMTNHTEAALLKSDSYRLDCAAAIVSGLVECYGLRLKPKTMFSDVPDKHWAAKFIEAAAEGGILSGYSDGTYRPDQPVTRAELAVVVAKMLEKTSN